MVISITGALTMLMLFLFELQHFMTVTTATTLVVDELVDEARPHPPPTPTGWLANMKRCCHYPSLSILQVLRVNFNVTLYQVLPWHLRHRAHADARTHCSRGVCLASSHTRGVTSSFPSHRNLPLASHAFHSRLRCHASISPSTCPI